MLAAVRALGKRRSCLIVGEPGIGKSRLVLEFARSLENDPESLVWRQGRCLPYGEGVALAPLAEIFRAHCGILDTDGPQAIERRIEAALPPSEDAAWLRQRLRALLGLPAPASPRDENFAGWRRLLDGLAASHPAVVVFEDLHWGHDVLLDFIDSFLGDAGSKPLLLIATTRPELLAGRPSVVAPGPEWSRIAAAVAPADIERLWWSRKGVAPWARRRYRRSLRGNPLFAEMYAGLLADGGVLPVSGRRGASGAESPPTPPDRSAPCLPRAWKDAARAQGGARRRFRVRRGLLAGRRGGGVPAAAAELARILLPSPIASSAVRPATSRRRRDGVPVLVRAGPGRG